MSSRSAFARIAFPILLGSFACASSPVSDRARLCTYETWDWDTVSRKAVHHARVEKPRSDLTPQETGPFSGCSVCREDQVEITVGALPPVLICAKFADQVKHALETSAREGFPLKSIVGYRVGRSKGALDSRGQRTEFSHHSYGVAIDVNSERNGLYDRCVSFGPHCRLLRGGAYRPGAPGSVSPETPVYRNFQSIGFRWGGELRGQQKDFMHFSPTGD